MIELYGYRMQAADTVASLTSQIPEQWLAAWNERHPALTAENSRVRERACESLTGLFLLRKGSLIPPEHALCYGANGRPFFKDAQVDFSITHTKGAILCAVMTGEGRVGLDAETVTRAENLSLNSLAERWFSEQEKALYLANPTAERFFTIWTRKEAAVKASGEGLSSLRESDTALMEREGKAAFATYRDGDLILTLCHPSSEKPPHAIQWI